MKREYRATPNGLTNATGNTVRGYFAKFNSESCDLGGFTEVLAPGCFAESLRANPDVLALVDHNTGQVIGRTTSGTLSLREDNIGLAFEVELPDTSYARDLRALLERGDISQCSFGMSVPTDGGTWERRDGKMLRTIIKANLFGGSIVAMPAYTDTQAQLRSMFPDGAVVIPDLEQRAADAVEDVADGVCDCDCPQCVAGSCGICSDDDCDDIDCDFNDVDPDDDETRRLWAEVMELRLALLNAETL